MTNSPFLIRINVLKQSRAFSTQQGFHDFHINLNIYLWQSQQFYCAMEGKQNEGLDISQQAFEEESRKAKLFQDEYRMFVDQLREKVRNQKPSILLVLSNHIVRFVPDQREYFHLEIESLVSGLLKRNSGVGQQVASEFEKIYQKDHSQKLKKSEIRTSDLSSSSNKNLTLIWKVSTINSQRELSGKLRQIHFGFFYGIFAQEKMQVENGESLNQSFRFFSRPQMSRNNIFSDNHIAIVECLIQGQPKNYVIGVLKANKVITLSKYFLNGQMPGKIFLPQKFSSFPVKIQDFQINQAKKGFYEHSQFKIVENAFAVIELNTTKNVNNSRFAVSLNLFHFDCPGKILSYSIKYDSVTLDIIERKFSDKIEKQQTEGLLLRKYTIEPKSQVHEFSFYDIKGFSYPKDHNIQLQGTQCERYMNGIAIFEVLQDDKLTQYGVGVYYYANNSITTLNKYFKNRYNFQRKIGNIYLKKDGKSLKLPFNFNKYSLNQNFDLLIYTNYIQFGKNNFFVLLALQTDIRNTQFPLEMLTRQDLKKKFPSMNSKNFKEKSVVKGFCIGLDRYQTLDSQILSKVQFEECHISRIRPQLTAGIIVIRESNEPNNEYLYGFYDNIFNSGGQDYYLQLIAQSKQDQHIQNQVFMCDQKVEKPLNADTRFPYNSIGFFWIKNGFGTVEQLCSINQTNNSFLITCAHNVVMGNKKLQSADLKFDFEKEEIQEQPCRFEALHEKRSLKIEEILCPDEYMNPSTLNLKTFFSKRGKKQVQIMHQQYFDIAIIKLSEKLPKKQGVECGFQIQLIEKPPNFILDKHFQVAGFPAQNQFGKKRGVIYMQSGTSHDYCFEISDPIQNDNKSLRIIKYTLSTQKGNSGSPVYEKINEDKCTLLGIHTTGSKREDRIDDFAPHNFATYLYSKHIYDWLLKIKGIHTVVKGMSELFSSIAIIQLDNQSFELGIFKYPNQVIMLESNNTKDIAEKNIYLKKYSIINDQNHQILKYNLKKSDEFDIFKVKEVMDSDVAGFVVLKLYKNKDLNNRVRLNFQGYKYHPSLIVGIQLAQGKDILLTAQYFQESEKQSLKQGLLFSYLSEQKEMFYGYFRNQIIKFEQVYDCILPFPKSSVGCFKSQNGFGSAALVYHQDSKICKYIVTCAYNFCSPRGECLIENPEQFQFCLIEDKLFAHPKNHWFKIKKIFIPKQYIDRKDQTFNIAIAELNVPIKTDHAFTLDPNQGYFEEKNQRELIGINGKEKTLQVSSRSDKDELSSFFVDQSLLWHNLKTAPGFGGGPIYMKKERHNYLFGLHAAKNKLKQPQYTKSATYIYCEQVWNWIKETIDQNRLYNALFQSL